MPIVSKSGGLILLEPSASVVGLQGLLSLYLYFVLLLLLLLIIIIIIIMSLLRHTFFKDIFWEVNFVNIGHLIF